MVDQLDLPIDLVFVRHGESEGNVVHRLNDTKMSKRLDKIKDTFDYRLTDIGLEQAKQAGQWIRENVFDQFDSYYSSDFLRARETAAHLGFVDSKWMISPSICEQYEKIDDDFRLTRTLGPEHFISELRHTKVGSRVIVVCHANVIHSLMIYLERISYHSRESIAVHLPAVYNCSVLWYSRRDPISGSIADSPRWRSISTPSTSLAKPKWISIERPRFSVEELLKDVEMSKRIFNRDPSKEKQKSITSKISLDIDWSELF